MSPKSLLSSIEKADDVDRCLGQTRIVLRLVSSEIKDLEMDLETETANYKRAKAGRLASEAELLSLQKTKGTSNGNTPATAPTEADYSPQIGSPDQDELPDSLADELEEV